MVMTKGESMRKARNRAKCQQHNCRGFQVCPRPRSTHWNVARREMGELIQSSCLQTHYESALMNTSGAAVR